MRRPIRSLLISLPVWLMLCVPYAFAGGPLGAVRTLDFATKAFIVTALLDVDALPRGIDMNDDERIADAVGEFIWKHHDEIAHEGSESEQVDVAICLLHKHGYNAGPIMNDYMKDFCRVHLFEFSN